ncbi:hypothetical protein ACROYT_G039667 [Oculina patagonica]
MFMILTGKGTLVKGACFDNVISDVSYTATSTDPDHSPSDAVLDNNRAWCTSQSPPNEYLEVDLGHLYDVCGIVLQGFKNDTVDSFTTKYMLSFSKRRPAWSYYLDNSHSRMEFTIAPDNGNNLTEHEFPAPRIATAIRIHPVETNGPLTCLRVGVYGTQVLNVRCDEHLMVISISKYALGPEITELYVGQRIPGCKFPVIPNTDMTVSIGVGTCGTQRWIRGYHLYYFNIVHGKAEVDGQSHVVYSEDVAFNATCVYNRNATVTAGYTPNVNYTLSVTEYGELNFSMIAYLDSEHTDELTNGDQPLDVGTRLYVRVGVSSRNEKLDLLLDRCYATPTSNREATINRQFIVGGCPDLDVDNTTVHVCQNSSLQTFEINAFSFQESDRVYFHCDVLVCFAQAAASTCNDHCAACNSNARRRRSVDGELYDKGSSPVHLRIGPFQFQDGTVEKKQDTDFEQNTQDESTEHMVIVLAVSGVALVAIFITVVIVVMLLRNRSHSSEQTKILAPGSPTRAHAWSDAGMHADT